jgi:hypothetical protein
MADVKELIERLRLMGDRMKRHDYQTGDYWNVVDEAADALEATVNELNGRDHDIVILEAELAEEKRKREDAEHDLNVMRSEWLKKDQAFHAARAVAISIYAGENPFPIEAGHAERTVDERIEAKMKEKKPA